MKTYARAVAGPNFKHGCSTRTFCDDDCSSWEKVSSRNRKAYVPRKQAYYKAWTRSGDGRKSYRQGQGVALPPPVSLYAHGGKGCCAMHAHSATRCSHNHPKVRMNKKKNNPSINHPKKRMIDEDLDILIKEFKKLDFLDETDLSKKSNKKGKYNRERRMNKPSKKAYGKKNFNSKNSVPRPATPHPKGTVPTFRERIPKGTIKQNDETDLKGNQAFKDLCKCIMSGMKQKKKNELYKTTKRVKLEVPEVWLNVAERKTIFKSVLKGYQRKGILRKYLPELHRCFHLKLRESLQETLIYGELCKQQGELENIAVDHYFDMRALTELLTETVQEIPIFDSNRSHAFETFRRPPTTREFASVAITRQSTAKRKAEDSEETKDPEPMVETASRQAGIDDETNLRNESTISIESDTPFDFNTSTTEFPNESDNVRLEEQQLRTVENLEDELDAESVTPQDQFSRMTEAFHAVNLSIKLGIEEMRIKHGQDREERRLTREIERIKGEHLLTEVHRLLHQHNIDFKNHLDLMINSRRDENNVSKSPDATENIEHLRTKNDENIKYTEEVPVYPTNNVQEHVERVPLRTVDNNIRDENTSYSQKTDHISAISSSVADDPSSDEDSLDFKDLAYIMLNQTRLQNNQPILQRSRKKNPDKARAKLTKKLSEMAKDKKLRSLRIPYDPLERRVKFSRFVEDLKGVLKNFHSTEPILSQYPAILNPKKSVTDEAVGNLIHTYLDDEGRNVVGTTTKGTETLLQLQNYCAQVTPQDKTTYNTFLQGIKQMNNETAISFISRFRDAKLLATSVGNTYEDPELIDLFLNSIHKESRYYSQALTLQSDRRRETLSNIPVSERLTLSQVEMCFTTLDEHNKKRRHTAFMSSTVCGYCGKPGHIEAKCRKKFRDKKSKNRTSTQRTPRDISQITCHICKQKGHYANNCPKRGKDKESGNVATEFAAMAVSHFDKLQAFSAIFSNLESHHDINNWLIDSGASKHMTPNLNDFDCDSLEPTGKIVTIADGTELQCHRFGKVTLRMHSDFGQEFYAKLQDVLYVPGLARRLFSVPAFTKQKHSITFSSNSATLLFGPTKVPVTLPIPTSTDFYEDSLPVQLRDYDDSEINSNNPPNWKKKVSVEVLQKRLGSRPFKSILLANNDGCWSDVIAQASNDPLCDEIRVISTIRKKNRNFKSPSYDITGPNQMIGIDPIPTTIKTGLTSKTTVAYMLFIVDFYDRYCWLHDMSSYSTEAITTCLTQYRMQNNIASNTTVHIRADAGSQFTSEEFRVYCSENNFIFSLASPDHQEMNGISESTWKSVKQLAHSLQVQGRVGENFLYHALKYAVQIHRVLPIKNLYKNGRQSTPYELHYNKRPKVGKFRILFCPAIVRKHTSINNVKTPSIRATGQKGFRGIFIGFPENMAGYELYIPSTRQIISSSDVVFDERFESCTGITNPPYREAMSLRPVVDFTSHFSTSHEHTGDIITFAQPSHSPNQDPISIVDSEASEEDLSPSQTSIITQPPQTTENLENFHHREPDVVELRRSKRMRLPKYDENEWSLIASELSNGILPSIDVELAMDTADSSLREADVSRYLPEPKRVADVLKLQHKDPDLFQFWKKSFKKEMKLLIDDHATFTLDEPKEGEEVTPCMETFKVKITSAGLLDKGKTRICVRGDIQRKTITEDTWSPVSSFRLLKAFTAHAAKCKAIMFQLDYVGAFLQAQVRGRIFVKLPAHYAILCPEYAQYCGRPLRLIKAMYGMGLSGKFWFQDCMDWLVSDDVGFVQSDVEKALFTRKEKDGSMTYLLIYVDDSLYFNTANDVKLFEKQISERFTVEFMGRAHWFLSVRIAQDKDFNYTLDQNRYANMILTKYLGKIATNITTTETKRPLPEDFVPSKLDCSKSESEVETLTAEYRIDYASTVGALIYLSHTRVDLAYSVPKLAKFLKYPGRKHFQALIHVLRYIKSKPNLGLKYYSDFLQSPLYELLRNQEIQFKNFIISFSDSSWQDCIDTGKSTGSYIIMYQGGVIDHGSMVPTPVAMSSAEAEYNACAVAAMAVAHSRMLVNELNDVDPDDFGEAIKILVDNTSAQAMAKNEKDTKHTRHIARRMHYVRDGQQIGAHDLNYIPADLNLADPGTKNLGADELEPRLKYMMCIIKS